MFARISVNHHSVEEGESLTYKVELVNKDGHPVSVPEGKTVTVALAWTGEAANDSDSLGRLESVQIPAGTSSYSFTVTTVDDKRTEPTEVLEVTITGVRGADKLQVDANYSTARSEILDNDATPVAEDGLTQGREDTELVIQWESFHISDADSPAQDLGVVITKLPVEGKLFFLGSELTASDLGPDGLLISKAAIDSGALTFKPAANAAGFSGYGGTGVGNQQSHYAELQFKPTDGVNVGEAHKLVVDILPVVDAPSIDLVRLSSESHRSNTVVITKDGNTLITMTENAGGGHTIEGGHVISTFSDGNLKGTNGQVDIFELGDKLQWKNRDGVVQNIQSVTGDKTDFIKLSGDASRYEITYGSRVPGTNEPGADSTGFDGRIYDKVTKVYVSFNDIAGIIYGDGSYVSANHSGYTTTTGIGGYDTVVLKLSAMLGADRDGSETLSNVTVTGLNGSTVSSVVDKSGKALEFVVDGGKLTIINANHTSLPDVKITLQVPVKAGSLALHAEVSANETGLPASDAVTVHTGLDEVARSSLTGSVGNDNLQGTAGNDVIVADVQGLQMLPGQNYNLAFIVDTSGSMKTTEKQWVSTVWPFGYYKEVVLDDAVEKAKSALLSVFDQLLQSTKGDYAGTVNVYLSDFDSTVQGTVSVNLADPNAKSMLVGLLNTMVADGGTNYEAAFKDAANWFYSSQVKANIGTNLTYFITDGKPTYYQSAEKTNPVLVDYKSDTDKTLDGILKDANYKPGDVVTMKLGGVERVIVDASGTVYKWTETSGKKGQLQWNKETLTSTSVKLLPQGDGTYELSERGGDGKTTDTEVTKQSGDAFKLLSGVSVVEAIGLGKFLSNADLKNYDSDGVVQTGIDASKLAEAVMGKGAALASGDDVVKGGDGDDIIFGDQIQHGEAQGFAALQAIVAEKLGGGISADQVSIKQVQAYITEHHAEFDKSYGDGGNDRLEGGAGNDILFGQGGNDTLLGGEGNDILYGGAGNDILVGGAGNDILIGGDGDDLFVWYRGDEGTTKAPAVDVVKDFGNGHDVLDLSDLLQGENASNLSSYLGASTETVNGKVSTVLNISSNGHLGADGVSGADQKIVLEGLQLDTSDQAKLLQDLISQGKLHVDL